jgi:hypothetical protein
MLGTKLPQTLREKHSYTILGLGLNIATPTYRTSHTMIHQSICQEKIARVHNMGANPFVNLLFPSNMDSWIATYLSGNPHIVVQKKHCGGPPLRPSALLDYSYSTGFQILLLLTKTYRTFHHLHNSSTTNYNTLKVQL